MSEETPVPSAVPVLIAGGGPVGLALAGLLARHGIASLVVEADEGYCQGSRAICISRRSLEILSWIGADAALLAKGLAWTGGRSYYRNAEVLHFRMRHDARQRYAPMVNIQQYYVEEYAHRALAAFGSLGRVLWNARLVDIARTPAGATVRIERGGRQHAVDAQWVVACDGGRSTVRERLGLSLQGMQYEGRYVIVDIRQKSRRPVERLAWFDPPSNPGSTLLMHRQPDDVWRIDYQIRDDEDPEQAVKPENVLPRVRSHLEMIGETEAWEPLWISVYNAKCLTLESYRHGRVLFAGDAAHLVPIFGVRGLNSGLDDAANLAWKLARVLQGRSGEALLDTYGQERVLAARMNIASGAKSTEFMAPPDHGFGLLREAVLRLSLQHDSAVRSLIDPRQSEAVSYAGSALNVFDGAPGEAPLAAPGMPAPELQFADGAGHLTARFGGEYAALVFGDGPEAAACAAALRANPADAGLGVMHIGTGGDARAADTAQLAAGYAPDRLPLYLVRPDGYVAARWARPDAAAVAAALGTHHCFAQ